MLRQSPEEIPLHHVLLEDLKHRLRLHLCTFPFSKNSFLTSYQPLTFSLILAMSMGLRRIPSLSFIFFSTLSPLESAMAAANLVSRSPQLSASSGAWTVAEAIARLGTEKKFTFKTVFIIGYLNKSACCTIGLAKRMFLRIN
jgi:hypothetical protein